eukprot:3886466-Karenia_brevis.AAC.1
MRQPAVVSVAHSVEWACRSCSPEFDGTGSVHLKARNLGATSPAHTFHKPGASWLPLHVLPPAAAPGAHWAEWACISYTPMSDGAGLSGQWARSLGAPSHHHRCHR